MMEEEREEEYEMTDEDFNRFLEILAQLCERCASPDEAAELLRGIKVSGNGNITAILNVVNLLAEKCETIEEFRQSFAEVLADK